MIIEKSRRERERERLGERKQMVNEKVEGRHFLCMI